MDETNNEPTSIVRVSVSQYSVGCLPEDDIDSEIFDVTVEYRGKDTWAVVRLGRCLSRTGEWSREPVVTQRMDEWLVEHRFSRREALELAMRAAPLIVTNGYTVTGERITSEEARARWEQEWQ